MQTLHFAIPVKENSHLAMKKKTNMQTLHGHNCSSTYWQTSCTEEQNPCPWACWNLRLSLRLSLQSSFQSSFQRHVSYQLLWRAKTGLITVLASQERLQILQLFYNYILSMTKLLITLTCSLFSKILPPLFHAEGLIPAALTDIR